MQLLHSSEDSSSLNLSFINPSISVLQMPSVEMFNIEDDTFVGTGLERFYCCYSSSLQALAVEPTSSAIGCAGLPTMGEANSVQFPETVEGAKRKFL